MLNLIVQSAIELKFIQIDRAEKVWFVMNEKVYTVFDYCAENRFMRWYRVHTAHIWLAL